MYNGIGLQTPRGSGTNGYIQTNKFFVKSKTVDKETRGGFEGEQGTAGITKKPNKDILEHDRKRQIHLKLAILEDKLIEQGYTDNEIAEKLEEARRNLEAASNDEAAAQIAETRHSETQSHQIAARKEKQMEILRGALGIKVSDPNDVEIGELVDDGPRNKNGNREKRKHSFLDRDYTWNKQDKSKSLSPVDEKDEDDGDYEDRKHPGKKRRRDSLVLDRGVKGKQIPSKNKEKRNEKHGKDRRGDEISENSDDSSNDSKTRMKRVKSEKKSNNRVKKYVRHDSSSDESDYSGSGDGISSEDSEQSNRKTKLKNKPAKKLARHDSDIDSESEERDSGAKKERASKIAVIKPRSHESYDKAKMRRKAEDQRRPKDSNRMPSDTSDSEGYSKRKRKGGEEEPKRGRPYTNKAANIAVAEGSKPNGPHDSSNDSEREDKLKSMKRMAANDDHVCGTNLEKVREERHEGYEDRYQPKRDEEDDLIYERRRGSRKEDLDVRGRDYKRKFEYSESESFRSREYDREYNRREERGTRRCYYDD